MLANNCGDSCRNGKVIGRKRGCQHARRRDMESLTASAAV